MASLPAGAKCKIGAAHSPQNFAVGLFSKSHLPHSRPNGAARCKRFSLESVPFGAYTAFLRGESAPTDRHRLQKAGDLGNVLFFPDGGTSAIRVMRASARPIRWPLMQRF